MDINVKKEMDIVITEKEENALYMVQELAENILYMDKDNEMIEDFINRYRNEMCHKISFNTHDFIEMIMNLSMALINRKHDGKK